MKRVIPPKVGTQYSSYMDIELFGRGATDISSNSFTSENTLTSSINERRRRTSDFDAPTVEKRDSVNRHSQSSGFSSIEFFGKRDSHPGTASGFSMASVDVLENGDDTSYSKAKFNNDVKDSIGKMKKHYLKYGFSGLFCVKHNDYSRLKADFRKEMRHLSKLRHPCITVSFMI